MTFSCIYFLSLIDLYEEENFIKVNLKSKDEEKLKNTLLK